MDIQFKTTKMVFQILIALTYKLNYINGYMMMKKIKAMR